MFCPNCKVEYRPGFSECSDCQVALVDTLPDDGRAQGRAGDPADLQGGERLWSGADPRVHAAIRSALDAAAIPCEDEAPGSALFGTQTWAPFEIWIRKRDRDAAQRAMSGIFGNGADGTASDDSLQQSGDHIDTALSDGETGDYELADDIVEDFNPEDATAEVWSGDDKRMAQILKDCLRENGIGSVIADSGGALRLDVLPSSERRAREIIGEVVDGTPPE
ncbi:MAG: hypothetical protein ACRD4S_08635 [Candidatus Acidiferrales bacterium]